MMRTPGAEQRHNLTAGECIGRIPKHQVDHSCSRVYRATDIDQTGQNYPFPKFVFKDLNQTDESLGRGFLFFE
jgi:hypothetical protein